jgi:hypothetical protein
MWLLEGESRQLTGLTTALGSMRVFPPLPSLPGEENHGFQLSRSAMRIANGCYRLDYKGITFDACGRSQEVEGRVTAVISPELRPPKPS